MSTRSKTFVIHRQEAEKYVAGFAINPAEIADKSYVNMYLHHDGYIEGVGLDIAKWVKQMQDVKGFTKFSDPSRIASHLVKDFHYNSQYLYPNVDSCDHEYTWVIWTGKPDVWLSAYNQYTNVCEFVGTPDKLIHRYKQKNMGYTDWNEKYKLNTKDNG